MVTTDSRLPVATVAKNIICENEDLVETETKITRPSVNYARDWLDQLFLFTGLVWSVKGFQL